MKKDMKKRNEINQSTFMEEGIGFFLRKGVSIKLKTFQNLNRLGQYSDSSSPSWLSSLAPVGTPSNVLPPVIAKNIHFFFKKQHQGVQSSPC
jgi:hypothetical protein